MKPPDEDQPKLIPPVAESSSVSDAARALSSLGAKKGGDARAASLTPEERSRIGRDAIDTRWRRAGKLRVERELRATHKGSFREEFGIDVECYVLNDEARTA